MTKRRSLVTSGEGALEEAKLGDPTYLIGRVLLGEKLTEGEIWFVVEALRATAGKRYKNINRWGENLRITEQVVALTRSGVKQEAAIQAAMRQHSVSRRQVFNALKAHKKRVSCKAEELADAIAYGYEDKRCDACGAYTLVRKGNRMKCDTCDEITECP